MAPFPLVIHSVTGILTGCNYSSGHALFTRAGDPRISLGVTLTARLESRLCLGVHVCVHTRVRVPVCACVCVYSLKRKSSLEQFRHSKAAIQFVGMMNHLERRPRQGPSGLGERGGGAQQSKNVGLELSRGCGTGWLAGWRGDLKPAAPPLWASVSLMYKTRNYFIS